MKSVLDRALVVWKWLCKGYDSKDTSAVLFGGGMVAALNGDALQAVVFFLCSVGVRVPYFVKWLKNELLTEAQRAEIESNAYSVGLELQGKIFLTFGDEQGKIILQDELDSNLILEAVQTTMQDAIRLKNEPTV